MYVQIETPYLVHHFHKKKNLEHFVILPVRYLRGGKRNVNEISSDIRQNASQRAENGFALVLRHRRDRNIELRRDLSALRHRTAGDMGYIVLIVFVSPADLRCFSVCHKVSLNMPIIMNLFKV